jgi:hypothetical protein
MDTPMGFTRVLRWVWNLMCTSLERTRNSSASTREFIKEWFSEGVFFENLGAEGTKKSPVLPDEEHQTIGYTNDYFSV